MRHWHHWLPPMQAHNDIKCQCYTPCQILQQYILITYTFVTLLFTLVAFCTPGLIQGDDIVHRHLPIGGVNGTLSLGTFGYCFDVSNYISCSKRYDYTDNELLVRVNSTTEVPVKINKKDLSTVKAMTAINTAVFIAASAIFILKVLDTWTDIFPNFNLFGSLITYKLMAIFFWRWRLVGHSRACDQWSLCREFTRRPGYRIHFHHSCHRFASVVVLHFDVCCFKSAGGGNLLLVVVSRQMKTTECNFYKQDSYEMGKNRRKENVNVK